MRIGRSLLIGALAGSLLLQACVQTVAPVTPPVTEPPLVPQSELPLSNIEYTWTSDGSEVIYISQHGIKAMPVSGSGARVVLDTTLQVSHMMLSGDGLKLYFLLHGAGVNSSALCDISLNEGILHKLRDSVSGFSVSRTNVNLAFTDASSDSVFLINLQTNSLAALPRGFVGDFSPDERRCVFLSELENNYYLYDAQSKTMQFLASGVNNQNPFYSYGVAGTWWKSSGLYLLFVTMNSTPDQSTSNYVLRNSTTMDSTGLVSVNGFNYNLSEDGAIVASWVEKVISQNINGDPLTYQMILTWQNTYDYKEVGISGTYKPDGTPSIGIPRFSPDGKRILYMFNGALYILTR